MRRVTEYNTIKYLYRGIGRKRIRYEGRAYNLASSPLNVGPTSSIKSNRASDIIAEAVGYDDLHIYRIMKQSIEILEVMDIVV